MRRFLNITRNIVNWPAYLGYKYFSSGKGDFTFQVKNLGDIYVPRRLRHTFKECFFDEAYLKGFPFEIGQEKIKSVVDIGANVGYFSLYMLSKYPSAQVFSFEPMPNNIAQLNLYQSQSGNNNFRVFNKAVNGNGASLKLHYNAADDFSTSASVFEQEGEDDLIEVSATSLEQIFTENQLQTIDFLKLDCEGSEYDIVYNSPKDLFDRIKFMSIETHDGNADNENRDSLITYLQELGFKTNTNMYSLVWAWR